MSSNLVPGYFNATVPERVPTLSQYIVTLSLGSTTVIMNTDTFVVDRGYLSPADPVSGAATLTLLYAPQAGFPVTIYRNGLRLALGIDYTISVATISLAKPFTTGEVILVDYLVVF